MLKINSRNLGIQSGSVVLFSDYEHDGKMWSGSGSRSLREIVKFPEVFVGTPIVQATISMWDFDHGRNQRADISAQQIANDRFELVFKTWDDTRVARIRADWIAFGEVKSDDDWDFL